MQLPTAYVGIDVAKRFHVVCVKDAAKRSLIPPLQFDDTEDGYETLRCCFDALKTKHGIVMFSAALESTIPLLATIDGVGEVSAAVITASIGDPHRFSSVKQICAYFGLNPYIHTSGATIRGANHIQRKGDSTVRYYLFNCVLSMIRNEHHVIGAFYFRLLAKGKPKLVAITACMRKLISIMFTMLRTNTAFNPNFVHAA